MRDAHVTPLPNAWLLTALLAAVQITTDGLALRPLEPAGAANVLIFVTSDCPISNGYAPEIQRICQAYAAKGVSCQLVYEDVGVTTDAVKKHLADYRYGATPAAIDADGSLAIKVRATITPEAVVVDRSGAVKYRGRIDNQYVSLGHPRRVVTTHDLQDALDAVIAGRPIARPETDPIGCYIVPPEMRGKR
jgi:hypothetical protein